MSCHSLSDLLYLAASRSNTQEVARPKVPTVACLSVVITWDQISKRGFNSDWHNRSFRWETRESRVRIGGKTVASNEQASWGIREREREGEGDRKIENPGTRREIYVEGERYRRKDWRLSGKGIRDTNRRWKERNEGKEIKGMDKMPRRVHEGGFPEVIPGWWLQHDDCLDQEHRGEKGTTNFGWSDIFLCSLFANLEHRGGKRNRRTLKGGRILIRIS